jgi:hypothetical protein
MDVKNDVMRGCEDDENAREMRRKNPTNRYSFRLSFSGSNDIINLNANLSFKFHLVCEEKN